MKKNKVLAIILSVSLLPAMLAGCMPGSMQENKESAPVESPASDSQAVSEAASTEEASDAADGYSLPFCEPGSVSFSFLTYQNWHASSFYDSTDGLPVENKLEELTGVHIDWECPTSDYNTVAQTRLAAGTGLPDIMRIPNGTTGLMNAVNQGLILPLSDYMSPETTPYLYKLMDKQPIYRAYMQAPDGKIYGVAHSEYNVNNVVFMWNTIRKDWLDKLNLKMPETIDEYHDVLVAFRDQDPNGNGEKDEIPLIYQNEDMFGLYSFKTAFGFKYSDIWSQTDGKVAFDLMDDKFFDCLTTLHQWYEEGLLQQTITSSEGSTYLSQDRAGGRVLSSSDNLISDANLSKAIEPDAEFVFINPLYNPDYPENTDPYINKRNEFNDYFVITADCKNPEIAAKWLDWVYASEDSVTLRYWGIEGDTYTVDENGNKEYTKKVTDGSPIDVLREIGGFPNFVGNEYGEPILAMYKDTYVEEAYKTFSDRLESRLPIILGTEEENETYSKLWPDIDTYVRENVVNFIIGTRPLTDAEWENYKKDLTNMGIEDVIAVKQSWYDRADEIMGTNN